MFIMFFKAISPEHYIEMKTVHSKLRSIQRSFYELWLSILGNGHQTMTFEEDSVSNKNVNATS